MKESPTAILLLATPFRGGLLFAFDYRLTRKRVFELPEAHLVAGDVLLELIPYVRFYRLFISSYRIYVVAPAPEVPIAILVLEIRVTVEDHQTTLTFEKSYEFRYTVFRWNRYVEMYMVM